MVEFLFRLVTIEIPFSILRMINSFTITIFSKSCMEMTLIGYTSGILLLVSIFIYIFGLKKKETLNKAI